MSGEMSAPAPTGFSWSNFKCYGAFNGLLEQLLCRGNSWLMRTQEPIDRKRALDEIRELFVEFNGDVAGTEMIVLSDGAVTLPAQKFQMLIKTYKGARFLNFEGGPTSLKIQNFTMPILAWNPNPQPPGEFKLFRSQRNPDQNSEVSPTQRTRR